jgi:hypothetical protein
MLPSSGGTEQRHLVGSFGRRIEIFFSKGTHQCRLFPFPVPPEDDVRRRSRNAECLIALDGGRCPEFVTIWTDPFKVALIAMLTPHLDFKNVSDVVVMMDYFSCRCLHLPGRQ